MPAPAENERFLRALYRPDGAPGTAFHASPHGGPPGPFPLAEGDFTTSPRPLAAWADWLEALYLHRCRYQAGVDDDSVPLVPLWTGTQIYAAAFGAPVHCYADSPPAARPLAFSAREADRLAQPDAENCPLVHRILELARLLRQRLGGQAFFGAVDMQTGFDTAALLWDKTSFFTALADPEEQPAVDRLVAKCARFLKGVLAVLRREMPGLSPQHCPGAWTPPGMGAWVSNDECGALGPATFERFCLPELVDLSRTFGGLGMHCCAVAERHFPAFEKIGGFYAFNRGRGAPGGPGFGPAVRHFGRPGGPLLALGSIRDAEAADLVRHAPGGTRIQFVLDPLPVPEARRRHEMLRRLAEERKKE